MKKKSKKFFASLGERTTRLWKALENGYYDVDHGIHNLIRWLPVIWRDRDWDHAYIYDILKVKLQHVAKRAHDPNAYWDERDAAVLDRCVYLLDYLRHEKYEDEVRAEHAAKWGELHFNDLPENPEELAKIPADERFGSWWHVWREGARTPEEKAQESEEFCEKYREGERRCRRAKRELFLLLRRYIGGWWD